MSRCDFERSHLNDESKEFVNELIREKNLTLIHPYDNSNVILGQGTVALEMCQTLPDLDALVVPIGGLISGISVAAKAICPKIKFLVFRQKNFLQFIIF